MNNDPGRTSGLKQATHVSFATSAGGDGLVYCGLLSSHECVLHFGLQFEQVKD